MSGHKPYTMREMKGIVEYLTEHRAYSEVRGRKMWVDFASSSQTSRTWQSLKETFLKRILPDIQNPYYKLTREQVASFKQGIDVQAKEKNRLEIQREGEDSSKNANQKEIEPSDTTAEKRNEEDDALGENVKSATITARNRSSADTFVLDAEDQKITTEELLAELEEPTTSMRDCINYEYSEPPSVVREVLEDFVTESESSDREPQMEIVEDTNDDNTDINQEVIVVEDSENMDNVEYIEDERIIVEGEVEVDIGPTFDHEIVTEVSTSELPGINNWLEGEEVQKKTKEGIENEKDDVAETTEEPNQVETNQEAITEKTHEETELIVIQDSESQVEKSNETTKISLDNDNNNQNSLSTTTDTIIPNNQEVFESQKAYSKFDILAPLKDAASRKRSTSQDKTKSKKKKLDNGLEKTNGDTIEKTPPSSNNTEALFEALKTSENPDSTVQDESPQNKNPCLKSVSLFEEQFNTTKYSDSEEETPIPNNKEKISNITPEDRHEEIAKKVCNAEKEAVNDISVTKQDKGNPPDDINQKKARKTDPVQLEKPADINQEKQKTDSSVQLPEKMQIDPQEEQVKTDSKVQQEKTVKVDPKVVQTNGDKENVILLKSNSDSDEKRITPPSRKERSKHLAQAFGFVPGTSVTAAQRRRSLRSRNRTKSQRTSLTIHEPSDWEGSISEPELADGYISPPRGRRNRYARKYRKPQSGRIMSLDENGGLFVVHGNKIIPLVKNGKTLTFVTYDSLGCSEEEEELMWRQKYIDEKKKAAQLKQQLEEVTEAGTSRSKSPMLQKLPRENTCSTNTAQNPNETNMNKQMDIKQIGEAGKIQITLSKNKEETINLEGHWPQVLPLVQQVMSIFYKQDEATKPEKQQDKQKEDISGLVTPIIPVIDLESRKVEDLENAIFKEIEEHDKKEKSIITNVTKRKAGRPKKTPSTSSEHSEKSEKSVKRPRRSKQTDKPESSAQIDNKEDKEIAEASRKSIRKSSVAPSTESIEMVVEETSPKDAKRKEKISETDDDLAKTSAVEPRVTRARKSGSETDTSSRTVTTRLATKPALDPEEDIRYMLPPEGPKTRKSNRATPNKVRSEPHEVLQDMFQQSIDSTGYQDSDPSPTNLNTMKRKRKISVTVRKGKHVPRRRSFPTLSVHDLSLDSSNSSYFVPRKSRSQSTLDSAVYKTESYQILMGIPKVSITKLDVIDESKSDEPGQYASKDSSNHSNIVVEMGSSSNVSLPLSPELSVVENLSISHEMIRNENHPTINEIQCNDSVVNNIYNQYLISDVDVSVPLMEQDCELLNTPKVKTKVKKQRTPIKVSDLLDKVCTVNMSVNNTLSDTLDRKLRDLLLESAKKISDTNKENLMDIDESIEPKKRGKKRCSTPRKRNTKGKAKPAIGPVIDEHMETCSHGGRNSCPPVITFIPIDENAINSSDVQLPKKPKRIKKDIIKVKIQRPVTKKNKDVETSQLSVYTDSGINETASSVFQGDSVDLIHNHSETCLLANECINSVEFIENSKSESIISINSTASLESELLKVMEDVEMLSGEYRKAQDKSEKSSGEVFGTPTDTVYHSPVASNCSLITEDLSDEAPMPPSKWYLLSEDDTNTTRPDQMTSNSRVSNFSANLKQLFPVTCAVPDLSTISEFSKENEGIRKSFDTDGDTRNSDYQTLLD